KIRVRVSSPSTLKSSESPATSSNRSRKALLDSGDDGSYTSQQSFRAFVRAGISITVGPHFLNIIIKQSFNCIVRPMGLDVKENRRPATRRVSQGVVKITTRYLCKTWQRSNPGFTKPRTKKNGKP